jgi:hypothetical protein
MERYRAFYKTPVFSLYRTENPVWNGEGVIGPLLIYAEGLGDRFGVLAVSPCVPDPRR